MYLVHKFIYQKKADTRLEKLQDNIIESIRKIQKLNDEKENKPGVSGFFGRLKNSLGHLKTMDMVGGLFS